jgi:hypothetical protein
MVPKREEFAELTTRHRDLMGLCNRLQLLGRPIRGRWYAPTGQIAIGASLGGALGILPLAGASGLAAWVIPVYVASVVVVALVGGLLLHASRSVAEQRADSVAQIQLEFAELLAAFELEHVEVGADVVR